ncbi:DEAD/DEAH box helicase [Actinobacillus succinogenes]|uniref:Type III restriction protein res subunit n=1 Tax=Actinobacillus succinogenes (strain ATCC 55618 / DSM 22257 / CCUG 43843 / 130Z) TaxID=339671 RepID=A6VM50_ACTSZ|nr:DEAD/DEAH box helicase family protein [Actinobacillus succinogenes]ABR74047.1 type III restriction protein res subunit [Actinobacillus succinogenes 130Z]PHI39519.1 DEAD/DEAH box helicase [Actinobacillus succinogenes]
MKLQFETLDYQLNAVNAAVNLFIGQPNATSGFALRSQNDLRFIPNLPLQISDEQLQQNLANQQNYQKIDRTLLSENGKNFTVEMETGTGKTYVYLRTIFELNKQYGWQKFVIVVPSVAIREGVLHTLDITQTHFNHVFDKPSVSPKFEYKSNQLSRLKTFANSNHIEILVMNIDAFAKDSNVINTINESGEAPISYIQKANPIVIIDEPQNMETDIRRNAIESLNPLFTLRYSATHKNAYNPIFSLNPVQAYELGLVKQIEVDSVVAENEVNGVYLALKEIKTAAKSWSAKIELLFNDSKAMKKKVVTVKPNQDLYDFSNQNEMYRSGFILSGMDAESQMVEFSNGTQIFQGVDHSQLKDDLQKMQIRRTVAEHLQKEKKLRPLGVKVLSLFFIDKVDNYRSSAEKPSGGKFAQWFEEIYRELAKEEPSGVHNGYFSQDKKGVAKDTNGTTQVDNDTYQLIMRDKEKLLSLDNPLRFIFSHSALREGWDNPNVFQICTLNDTASEMKKRQEIGRGLRLPVNQHGQRIYDRAQSTLTVIANESYEQFAATLQREIEEDCGVKFAKSHIKKREDKREVRYRKDFSLHPDFVAIWERIKQQTTYRVNFSNDELIERAVEKIHKMPAIEATKIKHAKAKLVIDESGIATDYRAAGETTVHSQWAIPALLNELQKKTGLTRITLCKILQQSDRLQEVFRNPQRFIDLVAEKINAVLQLIMADGIEYRKIAGKSYEMTLFRDFEFYANPYTFAVNDKTKTIYEDCISLDSTTEYTFAKHCESSEDIEFYFKLPERFKIPTPLGNYNPDWAVVFKGENKIYFVAETKNTGKGIQSGVDEDKLRENEQLKIAYARKNFHYLRLDYPDLDYQVVENVEELSGQYRNLR